MEPIPQARRRILFVDDEEGIRVTMPPLLERYGFEVRAVGSVQEALAEINGRSYDALLSDLNIEKPGDGFLIVTAMRHAQPSCVNLLLTGYPSLETALHAVRSQVDDYFIKPADTDALVTTINRKIDARPAISSRFTSRLFTILHQNATSISADILERIKRDPATAAVPLSDKDRVDHLPMIFRVMIEQLEDDRDKLASEALAFSLAHGRKRRQQGYDLRMTVRDFQLIEEVVFDFIADNFLVWWSAETFGDLRRLAKGLHALAIESARAFQDPPGPKLRTKGSAS